MTLSLSNNEIQMNYPQHRYTSTRQCPTFDSKQEGFPTLLRQVQNVRYECRYADGTLYYLQGNKLVAETITGEQRWQVQVAEEALISISTAFIVGKRFLFLGLKDGLHVLEKADGKAVRLASPEDSYLDDACIENGELILMQEYNGQKSLNCYSEETLALLWSTPLKDYLQGFSANQDIIVTGALQTQCTCFDRKTGIMLWTFDVEELGKVQGHFSKGKVGRLPMLAGSQVILPVNGRYVVGLDSLSGKQNWATQTHNIVMSGNTSMDQAGKVHVLSTHYSRLNAETGAIEVECDILAEIIRSKVGIVSDHVVVGDFLFCRSSSQQQLYRFNLKSMAFDWSHDLPARAKGAPICVDGHLLVHDDKGGLSIFSLLGN